MITANQRLITKASAMLVRSSQAVSPKISCLSPYFTNVLQTRPSCDASHRGYSSSSFHCMNGRSTNVGIEITPSERYRSEYGIFRTARFSSLHVWQWYDQRSSRFKNQATILGWSHCQARHMTTLKKLNTSENIWTIPNLLCVTRMGMAPVLGYLVINSQFPYAIGLLVVAGLTDLLDGWIARVVPGQSSVIGSFLDPMADKILIGTLFLTLTYMNFIPVPLTALVIGRDIILMGAAVWVRHQSLEPPRTFARYFDITSPSAQIAPTLISKVNTGVQLSLIGATLLSTVFPAIDHSHLVFIWYCTGGSTILSALSYVFAKDTYKIIKKTPANSGNKNENERRQRP